MNNKTKRIKTFLHILADNDVALGNQAKVLDFGCGNGDVVSAYRDEGYDAYGCDMTFKSGENVDSMVSNGFIRLIKQSPYRLPFEDNTFDLVVSDQVLEHVSDYSAAIEEIRRVMKVDGVSLHMFPSKYKFIEPHVHVPLATVFQWYWWLWLWAWLGIRKDSQAGKSVGEVARLNYEYLRSSTHYRSKDELVNQTRRYFRNIKFCEAEFLKYSDRGRYVYWLSSILPFLPNIYSCFVSRVVLFKN